MAEKKKAQFLNSFYHRQRFEDGKLVEPDRLEIVFRNLETGKKRVQSIEKPRINFYQLREEYEENMKHYQDYIERDKVIERTSYFSELPETLARLSGISDAEIYNMRREGKGKTFNKFHQMPIFYSSDIDIQDYYKGLFLDKYDSDGFYLTKGYFDIEVDTKGYEGFPDEEEAPCPVNALTYVNEENNTAYVLLLRNDKNPLIKELEDNIEEFRKEVKEEFDELYGEFEYRYLFFDTEVGLITEFFRLVNDLQPDFMLAWNQKFDVVTMINRLKHHGIDPEDVICHPDFKTKKCYFNVDKKHSNPEDRNDFFDCSSYSYYADQLLFYAQLRKGLGKKESYTLNAIANEELKDEKIDYTEVGTLSELPYIDYKMFVKYNIKDVFLCYKLEQKNQDVFLMYTIAHMTRTRLSKAMKKMAVSLNLLFLQARICLLLPLIVELPFSTVHLLQDR